MIVVWRAKLLDARGRPDHTKKLVLLRFADHANKQGLCWPAIPDVAAYSQLSERQVRREVSALLREGLLEEVKPGIRAGQGRPSRAPVYRVRLDNIRRLPQVGNSANGEDRLSNGEDTVSPPLAMARTQLCPPNLHKEFNRQEPSETAAAGGRGGCHPLHPLPS